MGADTPKQFLLLKGLPVMMPAIQAFRHSRSSPQIIVVIHPSLRDDWSTVCESHAFSVPHTLVNGGSRRCVRVKNGLKAMASIGGGGLHCIKSEREEWQE